MARALATALIGLLTALLLSAPGSAEIYRWTDAQGQVHFSSDLSQVPRAQRPAAREAAEQPPPARVQRFSAPESSAVARRGLMREARIPFQRRGTLMMVTVKLNDEIEAPFLMDTGASAVSIPRALADKLGIHIGPDTPRVRVTTANGVVAEPLVELESVQLGPARVERIRTFVSSSMDIGLLGGAFFNNFLYRVDSAAGEITLAPNDRMRGGLSEDQWRQHFQQLRGTLDSVRSYLSENQLTDRSRVRTLEGRASDLEGRLEDLEDRANSAGVPQAWRQ